MRIAEYAPHGEPSVPTQIHIGTADEFASAADWRRLDELASLPTVAVHRYDTALHGFANAHRPERFSAADAARAHHRTLAALLA